MNNKIIIFFYNSIVSFFFSVGVIKIDMSYPDDETKAKLIRALDLYDGDKSYENFKRKAFDDDNDLINILNEEIEDYDKVIKL